ncbi:MAG: arylsulfatase B [Candidatus Pelagisphaera sp.]
MNGELERANMIDRNYFLTTKDTEVRSFYKLNSSVPPCPSWLKSLIGYIVVSLLPVFASAEGIGSRPNIIVIMCDDLGYSDVGFNGATDIRTPELDRLAKAGTIFSSAYVAHPFCGPSRMGFMAGRYPHEFGAPFNLPNPGLGIEAFNRKGIPTSEVLISATLQKAGYFTGAIGKWHMGIDPQFHPNVRGFDDFYGFLGGGHRYFPEQYQPIYDRQFKNGIKHINEYFVPLEHNGKQVRETEYITDAFSREAVRFVTEASEKDQPFFLFLAYNAPHSPLEAKEADEALYSDIKDDKRRKYAAMVYSVDRGVGEIVEALKVANVFKNTLIVFLSDNGGKLSLGATNRPLTNGKGSVSEGGFRVPLFFHWPDKVPAGKRFQYPVSALDFYPMFAGLGGAEIPEGKDLDGKNIWEGVVSGMNPRKGEMIYAVRHHGGFSDVGGRRDRWKVKREGKSPWTFFNIEEDISEQRDLSSQYPELMQSMITEIEQWSQSHTEPEWFYVQEEADRWEELDMPRYGETFRLK